MYRRRITVEWGDCDEAGIVFYPNYFYWMDCTFQGLLRSHELGQRQLRSRFGAVTPLLDVGARFVMPVRYDEELTLEALVVEWHEKRFKLEYRMTNEAAATVATGHELRAWVSVGADGRMKSKPIPQEFKDIFHPA